VPDPVVPVDQHAEAAVGVAEHPGQKADEKVAVPCQLAHRLRRSGTVRAVDVLDERMHRGRYFFLEQDRSLPVDQGVRQVDRNVRPEPQQVVRRVGALRFSGHERDLSCSPPPRCSGAGRSGSRRGGLMPRRIFVVGFRVVFPVVGIGARISRVGVVLERRHVVVLLVRARALRRRPGGRRLVPEGGHGPLSCSEDVVGFGLELLAQGLGLRPQGNLVLLPGVLVRYRIVRHRVVLVRSRLLRCRVTNLFGLRIFRIGFLERLRAGGHLGRSGHGGSFAGCCGRPHGAVRRARVVGRPYGLLLVERMLLEGISEVGPPT